MAGKLTMIEHEWMIYEKGKRDSTGADMRVLWSITEESRTRKAELKGGWNMGLFEPAWKSFCIRCGEELPHNFDENGVCKICRARYVEEEEIMTEARVQYAKRTNRRIEYPDGRVKHLDPETRILVDDSTMRWLFPND